MPLLPEAADIGTPITIFSSTTRKREDDGSFGHRRTNDLSLLELTIVVPPDHKPGRLSYRHLNPNPQRDFAIAESRGLEDVSALRTALLENKRQTGSDLVEVTVFVHGYNSSHTETAYRAAQITYDLDLPGSVLFYSWPSRARAYGYAYDQDSILFARDGLEQTLELLKRAGADRIILVAHSMGSALTMETLRQIDGKVPGKAARISSGGVVLISPDLDVELFERQLSAFKAIPEPFTVLVSEKDKILNLSAKLRGIDQRSRLGNIRSAEDLGEWPIQVVDLTAFNKDSSSGHFVAATSPSLLKLLQSAVNVNRVLSPSDSGLISRLIPAAIKSDGKIWLPGPTSGAAVDTHNTPHPHHD